MVEKVCLVVIDGWGISEETEGNAIKNAKTPVMDELCTLSPSYLTLNASGLAVGLPDGLMGNSEVGHLNLGAGRPVYQDIVRINLTCEQNELGKQANLVKAFDICKSGNGRLHLMGLVSDGGVHSHINHLFAFLQTAKAAAIPHTYIHFISDGRDTKPTSGISHVSKLHDFLKQANYGSLATVVGRYYAMDRDKRHERVKKAYEGFVQGIGENVDSIEAVVELMKSRYEAEGDNKQTDEFMQPIIVDMDGRIRDGDVLLFFNYRSDRMRQIVEAFGINPQFETNVLAKNLHILCMTQYKEDFPFDIIFPPQVNTNVIAEWLSVNHIPQFHCAETEKYAHVTFFFNGGQEKQFEGEERSLVPSPKVATYDLKPEMSVMEVAEEMCKAIKSGKYPFLMCNLAPPDMVGHTGKYDPCVLACQSTDVAIGMMREACKTSGYTLLVTADHGNAEKMYSETGGPHTAHTTNRVPFCMYGSKREFKKCEHDPALCDVAPTILTLMGFNPPKQMTGQNLLS
ncbi:2,3-bisphosphoglycerate-independent phosphoglycerate mutase [Oopsacas minuta]|uniref:phosphoglycerate mutase (2,3-diphosphoglycerate-independent) n=1 Tax=Oopsacas minuta TaxID=111878 RepID=A0AAV7K2T9_9METZ|nr:2,3-bisphosphoglycerate-independent phosphoglycerate mutase [Oopsacas minuta]